MLTVGHELIVIDAHRAQGAEEGINGAVAHAADFVVHVLEPEHTLKMHLGLPILAVMLLIELVALQVVGVFNLKIFLVEQIKNLFRL